MMMMLVMISDICLPHLQVARTSSSQTDEESDTGQGHAEDEGQCDGQSQAVTSDPQNVLGRL